jgi:hypothetical protein
MGRDLGVGFAEKEHDHTVRTAIWYYAVVRKEIASTPYHHSEAVRRKFREEMASSKKSPCFVHPQ